MLRASGLDDAWVRRLMAGNAAALFGLRAEAGVL